MAVTEITFARPLYLIFLAAIPLVIFAHFYMLKRKRSHALSFANFDAIARARGIHLVSKNISILLMTVLVFVMVIFSLAGITLVRTLYSSSSSFVIAIDSSESMGADDFSPNRLEVAKATAVSFVDALPAGTKVGVLSFSGNAFIESGLTNDKTLVKRAIREITLSSIGGTDLSEAVITASNLLRGEEAKSIVLLSDGRINVGTVDDAINYANENWVFVHTVGIGTVEGGITSYGLSKMDEDALRAIAFNTDGQYFKAKSEEDLRSSLGEIIELKLAKVPFDLSPYLLIASLVFLLFEYVLVNTRYRVLP